MASQVSVPGLVSGDSGPGISGPDATGLAAGQGEAPAGIPNQGAESFTEATPAVQEQPPETESFEFAGERYASREAAEQAVKTALGRYRTAQSRAAEMEKAARDATQVARAWEEYAKREQRQPQVQTPQPQEPEKPWYDTLDWDFVTELAQEKGVQTALYWAMQQMDQRYTGLLDSRLKEALAPHEQRSQVTQKYEQSMDTFKQVAYQTDESGTLLFPELHDQDQARDVVRIWTTLDPSIALTPRGVLLAVLEYRHQNGIPRNGQTGALPSPAGANGASQGVLRGAQSSARASSEVLSGNGTPRPAPPGTPGASSFQKLIGGAPSTVKVKDFDLGFLPSY
jgi:hypothetical protein